MKEYRLGSRFFKYRNLCDILVAATVFAFYFVYDYIFSSTIQWWNSTMMAVVFLFIYIVFFALIWAGANMIYRNISYSITKDALVCTSWKETTQYPFHSFRSASLSISSFSSPLPVTFELEDGRTLRLNQYIEELPELTLQLLTQIAPFAQIDSQLKGVINS